ncbi:MAG: lamin tail domain-containing protein [bacterium]
MEGKCFKIIFCFLIGVFFVSLCFVFGATNDVVINEIMIGQTDAVKNEFIELYNPTENSIDLTGYKLKKKTKSGSESNLVSSSKFIGIIPAYGYFLITHPDYKNIINADLAYSGSSYSISSNNTIILYDQEDNIIDKVGYGEDASDFEDQASFEPKNNQSIERQPIGQDSDNNIIDFIIRDTPSPQNSVGQTPNLPEPDDDGGDPITENPSGSGVWVPPTIVNTPPIADAGVNITALVGQEISFDASLSSDFDNDTLNFFWNFGDGATDTQEKSTHIYIYPGQYVVSLMVSDEEFSDIDIIIINIYSQSVIISEFIPDPGGADTENEWIELFNQSDQIANLTNWRLDDQEEGSNEFIFPENSLIAPKQFLVLTRLITKLSLNNDQDQVRLIYPNGSLANQIDYSGNKKQGFSVAFNGFEYLWTKIPTPGSANIISSLNLEQGSDDISSNNPLPIIQKSGEPPEILANLNFTQSQNFSALDPPNNPTNNLIQEQVPLSGQTNDSNQTIQQTTESDNSPSQQQNNQSASLLDSSKSNGKNKLILIISIIISGSLIASWLLIKLKKKIT